MVDYIFGANKDKSVMKNELTGYRINAKVKFKNMIYDVDRILTELKKNNPDKILINSKQYDLDNYKSFFEIERRYFSPQILLKQKINEIYSQGKTVNQDEYITFLEAINLEELSEIAKTISDKQTNLKVKKSLVKELSPNSDLKELKKHISENKQRRNQELENISFELENVRKKVSTLQTSGLTQEMVSEREHALNIVKELELQIQLDEIEVRNLNNFVQETKNSIEPTLINQMFENAKLTIPDMVKKRLDDVYSFNQSIFEERRKLLLEKISNLKSQIKLNRLVVEEKSLLSDELGIIISENQEYQEALKIYEKFSNDYNRITIAFEKADSVDKIVEEIIALSRKIKEDLFIQARDANESEKYKKFKEKYLSFVKEFVERLYEDKNISTFDIKVREPSETAGAVFLSMDIESEGEGVGNVKTWIPETHNEEWLKKSSTIPTYITRLFPHASRRV